ncbi:MAG TPA: penicillin-binding transpeptidase domain-containing protein, partial [Sediminibacterium sp.]|nr:penicillin-binding transpeptidase domain-containing protein [Sediminibacterium sp.]
PTTLPWMAFGYNLTIAPLRTATLYNAVANGGKMMQPYLVGAIQDEGVPVKTFAPKVLEEQICSSQTLQLVRECLEGVCTEGTAAKVMQGTPYRVAGKTGTALVASGNRGYADEIYQSSFAGYFPADNPQYTCVVVIVNKPKALIHHGAEVAGPVFREIADRLYSTYIHAGKNEELQPVPDSSRFQYAGQRPDFLRIAHELGIRYTDAAGAQADWVTLSRNGGITLAQAKTSGENSMPDLRNRTLKDALTLCEQMGLKVDIKGTGRVTDQSIAAGAPIAKGQKITMALNPVN